MKEQWVVAAKKADFAKIGERFGIDPVTARLLRNRDLVEEREMEQYLHGTLADLREAAQMKDLCKGAAILERKIKERARIRIIGDYDIDGVSSTYILKRGLTAAGACADTKLPDRIADGYGLNRHLIEQAKEDGIDTILTCDNGIAAYEEVAFAKELGMTVIVTDHHEVPFEENDGVQTEKLPPADAVINPRQRACAYPFKKLCGAGVAYRFVEMLLAQTKGAGEILEELLEFAAIATVGDVMDLQGENRILVREGLKRIGSTRNIGLKALIGANGLTDKKINTYHIGFVLGPCINASGRLDTAERALRLFEETDEQKARILADDLVAMNESRKALTEQGVEEAAAKIEAFDSLDRVLLVYLPDCHESLAGIIAGRLRERYYRPVFVLTRAQDGVKGSGRSIEGYHMFEELCRCKDLLGKFGGHPMAAGLSTEETKIEELRRRLNANCTLTEKDFIPKLHIDIPMPISYVTKELVGELELLEPFGKGNAKPLFAQKGISAFDCRIFGKNQNVAKVSLDDGRGCRREGIYFGDTEAFAKRVEEGTPLAVAYYPEINRFRGQETLQFVIQSYF